MPELATAAPEHPAPKMAAYELIDKGKREAALHLQNEILRLNGIHQLEGLLDVILDPTKPLKDNESIDWCKWIIAGGRNPDDFCTTVKKYDSATACGLVWTANFIAYRCRTCGISPCMSLCAECFQRGNHEGHDFNMFRSQAGGACDCGDSSVMKESGFCNKHVFRGHLDKVVPPPDLLTLADRMMPRVFLRLVHHLRDKSASTLKLPLSEQKAKQQQILQDADDFIQMLHQFSELGAAMRHVMTKALTSAELYSTLMETNLDDAAKSKYARNSNTKYLESLQSLPFPDLKGLYEGFPNIPSHLHHTTLLEELVFWTVKYEFPQKLVCLLLNMMPDSDYKGAFTKTFVQHYGCISLMLVNSSDADNLSNRVVHVSVQLFSNETLTFNMAKDMHLLYIMVGSLKLMMSQILIQSSLQEPEGNFNYVVDCSKDIMKEHCYWPLVSDLNNVLSHRPVALKFMNDTALLDIWFTFLSMFQGMNVNKRELIQHIEFEPNTYYAAFSAELEASAAPMWAMISHLKESSTIELTKQVLNCCLLFLEDWFDAIGFTDPEQDDSFQVSFHLPLHRYFAVFLGQAMRNQGADIESLLPQTSILQLIMMHPLRAQVAFYEILSGLWVRNGLQIKGQAMTYIQCHFCNSMVDADLYLLQVCAAKLDPDWFLMTVLERFHVAEWLSLATSRTNSFLDSEQEMLMLESCLSFIATLLSVRTNTGLTEEELTKLEVVALLCMGDKTHSQLMDLMPEKCGTAPQSKNFEYILNRVANYKAPNFEAGGHMLQGMYVPKNEVWEREFDPIYVLLRAVHRRDYQASLDRYAQYVKQAGKLKSGATPWPPYRIPGNLIKPYINILRLLHCKTMHALIFLILHKAVHEQNVSETALSLGLYLLEMAVRFPPSEHPTGKTTTQLLDEVPDMEFTEWFNGSWILTNVQHTISKVVISHEPEPTVQEESDDSCMELDVDMQELVDGSMFESRGPQGDGMVGMLESSMHFPALPTVNIPLALPPPHSSQALIPLSGSNIAVADVNIHSASQPINMALPSSSSSNRQIPRRRGRFRLLRIVPNMLNSSQTDALSASQDSHCVSPNLAVIPSTIATLIPPPRLKMHGTARVNMLQASESLPQLCGQSPLKALPCSTKNVIDVYESILSLLIKLHSKLTGTPDSYTSTVLDDSRIGDGSHFIGQILNRISMLSLRAARAIQEIRKNLWPQPNSQDAMGRSPETKDHIDKDERRRRARERQQKLMAEFASKQKAFMEQTLGSDTAMAEDSGSGGVGGTSSQMDDSLLNLFKLYDCVICGQTTPSTEDRPIGLVCLLQATTVLGHSYIGTEHLVLPCSDVEQQQQIKNASRAAELDRRIMDLNRHFDVSSWLMALNIGLEGGIHVQTCGHHLHLDCHKSYIQSLRSQQSQRQQSLATDRGEYSCPLCRQLANSVLPVSPDVGEITAVVQSRCNDQEAVAIELAQLIQSDPPTPQPKSNLTIAMGSIMEDMTVATYPQYKCRSVSFGRESIFLFICSIARTNLELEIIQRGGTLCSTSPTRSKRSCFVPLLHVLAMHSKILSPKPYTQVWAQTTGLQIDDEFSSLTVYEREVPLLLKDMIALLLQLMLLLPLHIDKAYYTCIVRILFNVIYVQVLAQISCKMTEEQRMKWKKIKKHALDQHLGLLPTVLGTLVDILEHSCVYEQDVDEPWRSTNWTIEQLEAQVKQLCLPFLRVASLLQHHIYQEDLPSITVPEEEYLHLSIYLGFLPPEQTKIESSAACLTWLLKDPKILLNNWCQAYMVFANKLPTAGQALLMQHHLWLQPRLLQLPEQYEKFFQYYHRKQCQKCGLLPKEPSVCLVCGTLVCLRETCCRYHSVFEAVQHSIDCGAGTAMFLAVNSSNVIVIRGKRVCLWGSVYLDSYGEEDKDLKRGKPLFLCHQRYQLLQHQWLNHSFDHTTRRWIWHKDVL